MRKIALLFCLAFSISAKSQESGYAVVGASSNIDNNVLNTGFSFGGGYRHKFIGVGVIADFYGIDKTKLEFATAALDIRGYFLKTENAPFVSVQPGYTLYDKSFSGLRVKGNFSFAALAGYEIRFRHEKPGLNIMLGYQYTSFKVLKSISKVNGMKCSLLFLL